MLLIHLPALLPQLNGQVYDNKVDIYSLGLILFEMLVPFGSGMERQEVMGRLKKKMLFPAEFQDFLHEVRGTGQWELGDDREERKVIS